MAHDVYMIHVPDSATLPRLAWRYDAVLRAMAELGPKARVLRVTEGEYCRDMTEDFRFRIEPEEYEDDDVADRRYRASRSEHFAFGKRVM